MNDQSKLKAIWPVKKLINFILYVFLFVLSINGLSAQDEDGCFESIVKLSGRISLFTSTPLNQASCNIQEVVDTMEGIHPLRVVGVDLYPLAHYQDSENGYKKAYNEYLSHIESTPGGFFAFFITYGESSLPKLTVEMRFPEGGRFDQFTSLEKLGIESLVSDSLSSISNQIDSDDAIKKIIQYAANLLTGSVPIEYDLSNFGFERMENVSAIYGDLQPIASQADNQDFTSQGIHDFSQLSVQGDPIGKQVKDAKDLSFLFTPETFVTSNIDDPAKCAMEDAQTLYSNSTEKFTLWVHIEYDGDGSYRLYGKTDSNISETEAEAIVNSFYSNYMADYYNTGDEVIVAARDDDQDDSLNKLNQERCQGDQFCTIWGAAKETIWGDGLQWGKNISAYCCVVHPTPDEIISSNPLEAIKNYYYGMGCGLIDGLVGTASALKILAGGVKEFSENNVVMPAFWADLFLRGQQNGAWLKVSYQKAKESIEFGFKMAKFITTLIISAPQILEQLYTALKNFVSDLNPFTGLMRTGYSVGIIGFEIIMEIATGGGAALAKLGGRLARMSTNLLETLLNPRHYGELLLDMGDKLWLKLNDAVLTTEQIVRRAVFNSRTKNCFIAGTLVAVGGGALDSKPIEELDLFDLVVTEDVTNLPAGSQDLEHFSGLVSSEQYLLDSYNEVLLEPWYKASFLSIETQGELHIARPLSWFTKYGIVELHDEAWIQLPEQGVDHQMRLMSNLELLNDREIQSLRLKGEFQPVTAVVKHKAPLVLTIVTSEGSCIGVTPEHPLFSETTNTWVNAGDIDCGNWLRTMADSTMVISVDTLFQLPTTVYNLEVRKNHNYFVGKSSILAHNSYSIAGTRKLKEALDNGTVIPRGHNENALRRLSNEQLDEFLLESKAWTSVAGDYRKIAAWEVLYNRRNLRKRVDVLDKASRLLSLGYLSSTIRRIADGNALNSIAATPALIEVFDNLLAFRRYESRPGFYDVINQLEGGGSGHIGANWVVRFAGRGGLREAPITSLRFEFRTTPVGFPIDRRIDILYEDASNFVLFECKSVLPQNAFTNSNLRQFEYDLSYIENLGEIKWIFDGRKLPDGLNFNNFINRVNVEQTTINTLLGREGTIQELRNEIIERVDEIFKILQ